MAKTIYSGPAKAVIGTHTLQREGENGEVSLTLTEATADVAAAMFGKVAEQVLDKTAEVSLAPFDNWGSLPGLFPSYIGATTSGGAGALLVGTRPHGAVNVPTRLWTPDGRLYHVVRTAVVGHPVLHLGVGKALFGDVKISCLGDLDKMPGDSGYIFNASTVTESGASDPGGQMTLADFVRGAWVGVWGSISGFDAVEAEEEWTVTSDVKYIPLKVQGRTVAMQLTSAAFMAKCRPFGPTHSQILAATEAHTHGQLLGQADLVLTGPQSKTITLNNAEVKGAGFSFGGTRLGTGEVGFVSAMQFTSGAPDPLIVFSN